MYEQMLTRIGKAQWHANLLEDWVELFEWRSACYTWSVLKKMEMVFIDGKFAFGYQWSKQFTKGWSDYPLLLSLMHNFRGEITDVNIYDSFFEEEEMISWTTSCGSPAKGRILSWAPENYNLTNNNDTETVIGTAASDDLCKNQDDELKIFEIFDNGIGKSPIQGEQYCGRLNGKLTMVPTTQDDAFDILKRFNEHTRKKGLTAEKDYYFSTWLSGRAALEGTEFVETKTGFNYYPENGEWLARDPNTNEILGTPFPAVPASDTYSKPTQLCFVCGHIPTNRTLMLLEKIYPFGKPCPKNEPDCINFMAVGTNKCDVTNFPTIGLLCEFKEKPRLRLKGLCQESKVDNDYLLLGYDAVVNEGRHQERTYGGSTGWLLTYQKDEDSWQVKHEHYPHLTLTMEDKEQLPVGVHSWIAANNTCTLGQTVRLVFFSKNLSAFLRHTKTRKPSKKITIFWGLLKL